MRQDGGRTDSRLGDRNDEIGRRQRHSRRSLTDASDNLVSQCLIRIGNDGVTPNARHGTEQASSPPLRWVEAREGPPRMGLREHQRWVQRELRAGTQARTLALPGRKVEYLNVQRPLLRSNQEGEVNWTKGRPGGNDRSAGFPPPGPLVVG